MNTSLTTEEDRRPVVQLVGRDGNIFSMLHRAVRALERADQVEEARQLEQEIYNATSYDQAVQAIMRYVQAR